MGLALTDGVDARVDETSAPAACTTKQKKQRQQAIASYKKRMPKDRAAYFRKHKAKKLRAAFVKKQQARLKALQKALAACAKKTPVVPAPPSSDLSILKTVANSGNLTYTLTVRNAGPAPGPAHIIDELPTELELVSVGGQGWSCSGTSTVVCDSNGLVAVGAEATVVLVARAKTPGPVENTARVSTANVDPGSANNSASASTTVTPQTTPPSGPDVAVTIAAAQPALQQWNKQTYTMTVRNVGTTAATGVVLTGLLPQGSRLVGPAVGAPCSSPPAVSCALGSLVPGATFTVTAIARLNQPGAATMTAAVISTSTDSSALNDSAAVSTPVGPVAAPASAAAGSCSPTLSTALSPYEHPESWPTDFSVYLQPVGEVKVAMVFVDFSDAPGPKPTTDVYTGQSPSATEWYADASYGTVSVPIVRFDGWRRMPKPAAYYGSILENAKTPEFLQDAVATTDAVVNFGQFRVVYIVSTRPGDPVTASASTLLPAQAIGADGVELRHLVQSGIDVQAGVVAHEIAHQFGLPDLYDFDAAPGTVNHTWVGGWDPMSSPNPVFPHMLAWHKLKLGWLGPQHVRCVGPGGQLTETITPLAQAPLSPDVKAIVVPLGPSSAYVVEAREPVGQDSRICQNGILVYTVDATIPSGHGPVRLKPASSPAPGPADNICRVLYDAPFDVGPGETAVFEDANVKVEVLLASGTGYRVRVTRK
jgi:M6 family metalloprotease-like protein